MGKASWLHGWSYVGISMDETWWNCWHCWEWKHERGLDSACESVPGMFAVRFWTHDSWSQKPLPNNHHKPPANNWAQVNHEFDWICRIDSPRTNQIIRLFVDRTSMFFLRLTIFSTTWPKSHRWARTGVGICLLRCFFCPYRFLGLKNFEPQMLFAHLLHPRHEI